MDGEQDWAKLARTLSLLLRSSPTVESSTRAIRSVDMMIFDRETHDIEEQTPHRKPCLPSYLPRLRSGSVHLAPVLAMFLLSVYTLFSFFYRVDILTSENLLLLLIFMVILLFFASNIKASIRKNFSTYKNSFDDYVRRVEISCFGSESPSKPVQWFIGESGIEKIEKKRSTKMITREGVDFYSNGNFYEGEFHKGKCSGSGVYNYFVNGRYEGDWIDGRYDGYGIENWARGSRYKGQFRQGLRHGYGVYKFYTGDTYAGEWCNGQSNGIGEQICADGSSYSGEFKGGVKHGLGCYHFRNGDRYTGEYFGDKMHGFGVYQFANCHLYEGSWHEGGKQGYGMYTFRNSETQCSEWSGGNIKTPLPSSADAVLRAIQDNFDQLDMALKGADYFWTTLTLKLCSALETANKLVVSTKPSKVLLNFRGSPSFFLHRVDARSRRRLAISQWQTAPTTYCSGILDGQVHNRQYVLDAD